jgi:mannose-6-phosphate isomerase-like protein (cupin superfamily)
MKNRGIPLSRIALLFLATIGMLAVRAAPAQSRSAEFPAPQVAAQDNRTGPASDKPAPPVPSGGTMGAARAIPFDQMPVRPNGNGGESRMVAHGTLATGESVNLRQSMQVVGQTPSALHVIQHSEFILIREGQIEFDHEVAGQVVSEKAGPGDVLYVAFGTRHALKNIGTVPARYFIVAVGGDTK